MPVHSKGPSCDGCTGKLGSAHPSMSQFFLWVKDNHPDVHISQAWRNKEDQYEAFVEGKSLLQWPNSKHNHMDENGDPCSLALDLFQLDQEGKAVFSKSFYEQLYAECQVADLKIRWGGNFKHLKDYDHFEMIVEKT